MHRTKTIASTSLSLNAGKIITKNLIGMRTMQTNLIIIKNRKLERML